MTLPVLAFLVVIFALVMYVLLDGFDLGVGSLLLTSSDEDERDAMVESIAPVWDGNETWLILLGVTLLAAFPLAYSTVLPTLYLPILVMLMALGFRGVSFEFRFQTTRYRKAWDIAFASGSVVAALCQGLILGAALSGIPAADGHYAGGAFSFLSGFSILSALATVAAYAVLGAGWLHARTTGEVQRKAGRNLRLALASFAILACLAAAYMTLNDGPMGVAWHARRMAFILLAVGAVLLWALEWRSIGKMPVRARVYGIALITVFLVGIVVTVWPYIVPFSITIWEASAPSGSQFLLLIGVAVMLPVVLANGIYVYWTFRREPPRAVHPS
jgi:cytochrome d ubiquinol oxidase subunit II